MRTNQCITNSIRTGMLASALAGAATQPATRTATFGEDVAFLKQHTPLIVLSDASGAAAWSDLKLSGQQTVRDLWRQKDLGQFEGRFQITVAPHGAEMIRLHNPVP
jgi:hypothetical protein